MFTKTPWYAIPIAYIPFMYYFFMKSENSFFEKILLTFLGVFVWTLAEYLLHRFLFHSEDYWLPKHRYIFPMHFLMHGIHHAFP